MLIRGSKKKFWAVQPTWGAAAGSGASYSQQATDFFARVATAGGSLTSAQKTLYDSMITSIVTALGGNTSISAWPSKAKALWISAAPATASDGGKLIGSLNIVGNGASASFPLTETGTNTWTANTGWTGNGSTGYLDSGLNLTNASLGQNNLAFTVAANVTRTSSSSAILMGRQNSGLNCFIMPMQAASTVQAEVTNSINPTASNSDVRGIYTAVRAAAGSISLYKNSSTVVMNGVTDDNTGFVDGGSNNFFIGAFNAAGTPNFFSSDRIPAAGVWQALTSTEAFAIHSAINTLLSGLGTGANAY